MGLWLFNNKNSTGHKNYIEPIRQMLDNTWALSKTFHAPSDSIVTESIDLFNLFFKKLNGIVSSILKSVISLSSMAPGLSRFSTGFKNTCLEQEKRITDISKAGVSMTGSVQEIAENAEHLAVDSKKIYAQVQDALCLGEKSMEQFNEIKTFVEDLAHTIHELEENSISIGSILDMIGTISDESTILSLNARIEASRESGNGKGFKVIAEEMSSLAKQTKEATLEIQEKLSHLRATVTGSVNAMKNVEQNVSTGETLMDKANTALKSVHQGIDSLTCNIDLIKASTGLQSKDVKTVSKDILELENLIKNQSKAVDTIVTTTKEINNICDEMIVDTGIFHLSIHEDARNVAESMALAPDIRAMKREIREKAMVKFLKKYSFIELAYITNETGRQVTANMTSETIPEKNKNGTAYGKNWSKKEWFLEPRRKSSTFVSKVYRSTATDRFCFTVSVPLMDHNGNFSGVLAIDINFEDILKAQ